jgi:putative ubiquitin-RnfH superfamily antitoxin RatB of RatAB toxin-antitoxin module
MAAADGWLEVEVVYCPRPGVTDLVALRLPAGATLAQALQASGLVERHGLAGEVLRTGIWCKAREPDTALRDRDRVEVYRALTVDPKEARRLRYKRAPKPLRA